MYRTKDRKNWFATCCDEFYRIIVSTCGYEWLCVKAECEFYAATIVRMYVIIRCRKRRVGKVVSLCENSEKLICQRDIRVPMTFKN